MELTKLTTEQLHDKLRTYDIILKLRTDKGLTVITDPSELTIGDMGEIKEVLQFNGVEYSPITKSELIKLIKTTTYE